MVNDFLPWLTALAASIGTILGTWILIAKFIHPFMKRILTWINTWEKFMRDWAGTDAEPGRDAVPGVMERLNRIDGQLHNNGGSSIKDAVDRIEARLAEGDHEFKKIEKRLSSVEKKIDNLGL